MASRSADLCDDFERELADELANFDSLLMDPVNESALTERRKVHDFANRGFELAEEEEEHEALEEKLFIALARTETLTNELSTMNAQMFALSVQNEELRRENESLKSELNRSRSQAFKTSSEADCLANNDAVDSKDYAELEYLLAETRSKLARAQQAYDDQMIARELTEKELAHERVLRMHAEKEREAYSGAYEASLKHLDRWSQKKPLPAKTHSAQSYSRR